MTRFFDSSAIVAAYVAQAHTKRARALLRGRDVAVSRLAEIEVTSGLARLARETKRPAVQRDEAVSVFRGDIREWLVVELSTEVAATACELLLRHSLRAGDAAQLASALLLQQRLGKPLDAFVVFDRRLAQAARDERLTVIED